MATSGTEWLVGGGKAGDAVRARDWSDTPLGAREAWPEALRTTVNLVVASPVPMCLLWGVERCLFYNDAFGAIAGEAPSALGGSLHDAWPAIDSVLQAAVDATFARGESFDLERRCARIAEGDVDARFSVSAVRAGDGRVAGALVGLQVRAQRDSTPRETADARVHEPVVLDGLVASMVDLAERRQAVDIIREIFDSSFGFIGLLEVDGTVLMANRTAMDFVDASWSEIAGKPFWDTPWCAGSAETRELCRAAVQRAAAGELVRLEMTHSAPDGSPHYIDFTIKPIRDAAGNVIHLIPEGRDVTEQRRAEEYRRESDSRFRVLSELPTEAIMIHVQGVIVAANRAFAEMVGRPGEDLVGQDGIAVTPLSPSSREIVQSRLRTKVAGVSELELVGGDKDTIIVETEARDVRYGGVPARMVSMRDITKHKRAELALRSSEARLRACLENTPNVAVQWYDDDGHVLYWNAASERLYGWTREEALGKTLDQLIYSPEDAAEFLEVLRRIRETGTPAGPYETHVFTRDERSVWVLATTFAIPLDKHRTVFVCMDVDITERRAAEHALRESDARKDEFIAMLSHELRNPLAPITNALFLLEQALAGNPKTRRPLDVIGRQVAQLTHLVDDLLDVTRITRGKIDLATERLDLNQIARQVVEDHLAMCSAGGIELTTRHDPDAVWIVGDATRLTQVIGNLIQNAVKFTPRGGHVTLETGADPAREQAVLRVQDTGAGIAPEMMSRLFKPFAQGDRTLARSQGGLGLGLAVVKGLVEMHGGSVSAASPGVDQGATFTLRLPLDVTSTASREPLDAARAGEAPRRLLVIEDNVDAADSLRDAFELSGHTVAVAYDGPTGIEKARALHPDVVICDIGLPGMDGYEVARTLRADPELHLVTLVALSGYAATEDVAKAKNAGFDTHLAKPVSLQTLRRVMGEHPHAR